MIKVTPITFNRIIIDVNFGGVLMKLSEIDTGDLLGLATCLMAAVMFWKFILAPMV